MAVNPSVFKTDGSFAALFLAHPTSNYGHFAANVYDKKCNLSSGMMNMMQVSLLSKWPVGYN